MVAGSISQDKHKIVFRETAAEHPDAETGDVVLGYRNRTNHFLLRHSALWSSKSLIWTAKSPGEIVQSMMQGLNQFENNDAADQRPRIHDFRMMARMTTSHRENVKSNLRGSRCGHGRLSQSENEGVRSRATMRRLGQQSKAQRFAG